MTAVTLLAAPLYFGSSLGSILGVRSACGIEANGFNSLIPGFRPLNRSANSARSASSCARSAAVNSGAETTLSGIRGALDEIVGCVGVLGD
jgi:hypothetical protein